MEIVELLPDSKFFRQVINLGNRNSSTLGFLPEGAYKENAIRGQILIASESDQLMGYLYYNIHKRGNFVYIVQLCVSDEFRKMGVSRKLVTKLKAITSKEYRGIRVRCRRDYKLGQFWAGENFIPKGDIAGRCKTKATLLTQWWFDHGHIDLFSSIIDNLSSNSILTVLDANIFFDLNEERNQLNLPSYSLLEEGWIDDLITLCITPELLVEIDRRDSLSDREVALNRINQFINFQPSEKLLKKKIGSLLPYFPGVLSRSRNSDLKQLAYSLACNAEVFVSRDTKLLKLSEKIYSKFGMRILNPSALIGMLDSLVRESEYYPERYKGTLLSMSKVDVNDSNLAYKILAPQDEKVADLQRIIDICLSDPTNSQILKYYLSEDLHAVVAYQYEDGILKVPLFRILPNKTTGSLARHLLMKICIDSIKEGCNNILITDTYIPAQIERALVDLKFSFKDQWAKIGIPFIGSCFSFKAKIIENTYKAPQACIDHEELLDKTKNIAMEDSKSIYKLERYFWPAKFVEVDIPTYIVSIQPYWAMNLFDSNIASQDLFGGDPKLVFSLENAYYRSSKQQHYTAPARILWYVCKGDGSYADTQAICACSYLDEIYIDKPKNVYKQLKKFGVFEWKDVLSVAKGDIKNEVMGFRFSHTELFSNRVEISRLNLIWPKIEGKPFVPPQCPVKVKKNTFLEIYSMGQNLKREKNA